MDDRTGVDAAEPSPGAPDRGQFLSELVDAVAAHRQHDPTAPVNVIVNDAADVAGLRVALARSSEGSPLRLGVRVDTPLRFAKAHHGAQMATQAQLFYEVHAAIQNGYFARLAGMRGVVGPLIEAVRHWDSALPQARRRLVESARFELDRDRLQAVDKLHQEVAGRVHDSGYRLPSQLLSHALIPDSETLWIDARVRSGSPIEGAWLDRLKASTTTGSETRFHRLDPAECCDTTGGVGVSGSQPQLASLIGAVDPFDEAGVAARIVTLAMESGVAARDIAVVAPPSSFSRYRALVAAQLDQAGIPHDDEATAPARIASTGPGRTVVAFLDAAAHLKQTNDIRFDHVRSIIRAGGLPRAAGSVITDRQLRHLWRDIRGIDPATWSQNSVMREAEEASVAEVFRRVVVALQGAIEGTGEFQPWDHYSRLLATLVDGTAYGSDRASGPADVVASESIAQLSDAWSNREGSAPWRQAEEELSAVLRAPVGSPRVGVRIVGLDSAWALHAHTSVVVGMADDLEPGTQGGVGPLTAAEVVALQAEPEDLTKRVDDGSRALLALLGNSPVVHATYPRSDQLRTIVRQPSRYLVDWPVEVASQLDSVGAQFDLVDKSELGFLGAGDAAASLLRQGVPLGELDGLLANDGQAALACLRARRQPPTIGRTDPFNGDLSEVTEPARVVLSPDYRRNGGWSASPSRLEVLMSCPLGWWASRVMGAADSEPWDPPELDARARGKWVHTALVTLSDAHVLLAANLTHDAVLSSLWQAVGGRPTEELRRETADAELLGYRFRITDQDVLRAANDIELIATRLRTYLARRGGTVAATIHEQQLPARRLELPSGPGLSISGRVDRIDVFVDGDQLVTDYKTGAVGSGFQLAVYAWLNLEDDSTTTQLLYATPTLKDYSAVLLDDGDGDADYDRGRLAEYLVGRLTPAVTDAVAGQFPAMAGTPEHSKYCTVCAELIVDTSTWSSSPRSERSLALQNRTTVVEVTA